MEKNRNLLLGMFAAVGMLLATSCSQDELETVQSGNEAQVTFSLGLENNIGTRTRAISDGSQTHKLVYAVYDNSNKLIETITTADTKNDKNQFVKESAFAGGLTDNVSITLAKGQTYTVVFWAQNASCNAYTTDDLAAVEVDYSGTNNDETRDAFFGAKTFTVSGSENIDVTLKRPFAQINVGVTKADWDAAVASGIAINQSKVIIKNAAKKINLLDGTVSDEMEVTYNLATIPAAFDTPEDLKVDVNGDKTIEDNETYKWLSMSYILVNDDSGDGAQKTTLEGLEFTFKPETGNEIILKDGLTSVPVQRNWRTNILGKFLTGDITVNISIDPIYDGDHNHVVVSSAQELTEALADPDITNIILEGDLTGTNVNITSAKEIDLNNNTLKVNYINTRAPLVIKGGDVEAASGFAVRGYANANITLEDVNVTVSRDVNVNAIELGFINGSNQDCGDAQLTLINSTINSEGTGILIHGAQNKVKIENSTINHKWFGITQNGIVPGSEIELKNVNISGTYSGIYLSNNASGAKNVLNVDGGSICSNEESAIEVKKTDITVKNVTLSSNATSQSYSVNGGGSSGIGYGIVLAGYANGVAYEGDTSFDNITYNLTAQGDDVAKIIKYNGSVGEKVE